MNKGTIFLSGGGDVKQTFELDKKYFSLLKNNSKILYIPIALEKSMLGFEACYDWFSNLISKHSENKEIDFTMLLEKDEIPNFDNYDSIYIGGGNTYKLLDYIIKNKLSYKIINYLNNGGVIYGGSAGAIIFGKDIRTVKEENDKNYINFKGLNLLDNKLIICHYQKEMDEKIFEIVNEIGLKIIALPEESGMIVDLENNKIIKIGEISEFDENGKNILSN
jgi:dipeptidase E